MQYNEDIMKNFIIVLLILLLAGAGVALFFAYGEKEQEVGTVATVIATPMPVAQATVAPVTDKSLIEQMAMSDEEAQEILEGLFEQAERLQIIYGGNAQFDNNMELAGNPGYFVLGDSQIQSLQALEDFTVDVFSPGLVTAMGWDNPDLTQGENAYFKEDNGFLYINTNVGGMGLSADWDVDSARVVSGDDQELIVSMDLYRFDELEGNREVTLVRNQNGAWVFDSDIS